MKKFHLKNSSFLQWGIWQFVPSMYSFSNEFMVSTQLVEGGLNEDTQAHHSWVNHYPLRYATFGLNVRQEYFKDEAPKYYYLRSRYNDEELNSIYVIDEEDGFLRIRRTH